MVDLGGPLDETDCVIDFAAVLRAMKSILAEIDHAMLLPARSGQIQVAAGEKEVEVRFGDRSLGLSARGMPAAADRQHDGRAYGQLSGRAVVGTPCPEWSAAARVAADRVGRVARLFGSMRYLSFVVPALAGSRGGCNKCYPAEAGTTNAASCLAGSRVVRLLRME